MLFPPLRSGWTKKGEPADVEICGRNAKRVVFGTISLTGHRLLMIRRKQRAADFQAFLELVHEHYRHRQVMMILDGDSSHTARTSRRLAKELNITLEWLPVRSPELNAIEDVWGDAKETVCANHQFPDIDTEAEQLVNHIEQLTNQEAKRKAGLLSEDYWLFQ